jgi:hypothetical protein
MKYTRKIVKVINGTINNIPSKTVIYLIVCGETSRTHHVSRIGVNCYLNNSKKFRGFDMYHFKKPVSFSKANPLKSLDKYDLTRFVEHAAGQAYTEYLKTLKDLEGKVVWFSRFSGEGSIYIKSIDCSFPVYACNLKGKKTWFAETACVYLEEDQCVRIDKLAEVARGLTPIISDGVKFDAEKWDRLKDRDLAFKCDESGNATTGLFK